MDVGTLLINLLLQHGMAEVAKTVDSCTFCILLAILVVGFIYEWAKGALDWE